MAVYVNGCSISVPNSDVCLNVFISSFFKMVRSRRCFRHQDATEMQELLSCIYTDYSYILVYIYCSIRSRLKKLLGRLELLNSLTYEANFRASA